MGYKLVCLDMDGTLLNDKKQITQRTKNAIKDAYDKGVKIAISTGRVFPFTNYYYELLGVRGPAITSNGAFIKQRGMEQDIFKSSIKIDDCLLVLKLVKEYGMHCFFYTGDAVLTEKLNYVSKGYSEFNKDKPRELQVNLKKVNNWEEALKKNEDAVVKAFITGDSVENLIKLRKKIMEYPQFSITSSGINNFELMSKGVNKGKAVEKLAEYFNIPIEEVMCVGDSENDIQMIECAGLGVAMGNAIDSVKSKAGYITDTNNNDGVAKAIEKFVL